MFIEVIKHRFRNFDQYANRNIQLVKILKMNNLAWVDVKAEF